jgi:hypothetical protein
MARGAKHGAPPLKGHLSGDADRRQFYFVPGAVVPLDVPAPAPALPEVETPGVPEVELPEVEPPSVPEVLPEVLPEALEPELESPNCFRHLSRSTPIIPTHWGGIMVPPALELELPPGLPEAEPEVPPGALVLPPTLAPPPVLVPAPLPVVVPGVAPALVPALVPAEPEVLDCAHDALATPTNAAATATAIALTITIRSPGEC